MQPKNKPHCSVGALAIFEEQFSRSLLMSSNICGLFLDSGNANSGCSPAPAAIALGANCSASHFQEQRRAVTLHCGGDDDDWESRERPSLCLSVALSSLSDVNQALNEPVRARQCGLCGVVSGCSFKVFPAPSQAPSSWNFVTSSCIIPPRLHLHSC